MSPVCLASAASIVLPGSIGITKDVGLSHKLCGHGKVKRTHSQSIWCKGE